MRIRLLKDYDSYKKGEIVNLKKSEAFWVVETGVGMYTKDMTESDYKVTKVRRG